MTNKSYNLRSVFYVLASFVFIKGKTVSHSDQIVINEITLKRCDWTKYYTLERSSSQSLDYIIAPSYCGNVVAKELRQRKTKKTILATGFSTFTTDFNSTSVFACLDCRNDVEVRFKCCTDERTDITNLKSAECWTMGGVHYMTFDNKYYDFHGCKKYTLVEVGPVRYRFPYYFKVEVQNEIRNDLSDFSIMRDVHVTFGSKIYSLEKNGIVKINKKASVIPYSEIKPNYCTVDIFDLPMAIESGLSSKQLLIACPDLSSPIVVNFDAWYFASVTLPPEYQYLVQGFCGNFDGSSINDGDIFPDRFTTGADCPSDENLTLKKNVISNIGNYMGCDTEKEFSILMDSDKCGKLSRSHKENMFALCLTDPNTPSGLLFYFVMACVYDTCVTGDVKENILNAQLALVQICEQSGHVIMGWQSVLGDVRCPSIETPPNSEILVSSNTLAVGTTITMTCDVSYQNKGTPTTICQRNGFWSNELGSCERDDPCTLLENLQPEMCSMWSRRGFCESNQNFMSLRCQETCCRRSHMKKKFKPKQQVYCVDDQPLMCKKLSGYREFHRNMFCTSGGFGPLCQKSCRLC